MDSEGKGCCLFYAIGGIAILLFALVGGSNGTASDGAAIATMIVLVGAGIAAIAVMVGGKSSSHSSSHTNKKINYPSPPYSAGDASSGSEAYDEGYYDGFQDGKKAAESYKDKDSFYKCQSSYYGYYEEKYEDGYSQGFEYAYKAFKG